MVIRRTPRCPSTLLPVWLCLLTLAGCTSIDGPTADVDEWKSGWKDRAVAVKDGAAAGASAVGESLGTAYEGVRSGFEEPDPEAYGPYPKGFAGRIKRHMVRFEDVPDDATFEFGRPERGYSNRGILAGGEIDWQGWLVDVEIGTTTFAGQKRTNAYVVRLTHGEIEEVLEAEYAGALRRPDSETQPASAE